MTTAVAERRLMNSLSLTGLIYARNQHNCYQYTRLLLLLLRIGNTAVMIEAAAATAISAPCAQPREDLCLDSGNELHWRLRVC